MINSINEIISEHIGTQFTMTGIMPDPKNAVKNIVHGTIERFNEKVNVEVNIQKDSNEVWYWHITDEEITINSSYLGSIVLCGPVVVSDPSYDRSVDCMTVLHNVEQGIWHVRTCIDTLDTWGKRLYILELFHSCVPEDQQGNMSWKKTFELGVDTGTMSVISDTYYRRRYGSEISFETNFLAKNNFSETCRKLKDKYAGIYKKNNKPIGVICSSGIGDGSYPLYVVKNKKKKVIAMRISFM